MDLPKAKFILTPAGYAKLQKELTELESKSAQVSQNIKTARGYGDLSENFEYHEAKREQGFVQGRIMELKIILPAAHVVPTDPSAPPTLAELRAFAAARLSPAKLPRQVVVADRIPRTPGGKPLRRLLKA